MLSFVQIYVVFTMEVLHPLVYWAQTKEKITLRVDLRDVSVNLRNVSAKFTLQMMLSNEL